MSIASGLVVAGRRRARTYPSAQPAVRGKAGVQAKARESHAAVMARGVVWAALLIAASILGPLAVAAVMVPAAVISSVSAVRSMSRTQGVLSLPVAVGGPVLAAAALIVADWQSANLALTFACLVCLYDAACYLNGNGRRTGGRMGVGAGLLAVAILAVFVAAVLVPPFTGIRPWVIFGVTGLLAPAGVWLAGWATKWERLPGLRRVDSMILAAPVWAIFVVTVLHR